MASNLVCGLCVPIVGTHNRRSPNIFIASVRSAKSSFSHGLIVVSLCSKTLRPICKTGIGDRDFFFFFKKFLEYLGLPENAWRYSNFQLLIISEHSSDNRAMKMFFS